MAKTNKIEVTEIKPFYRRKIYKVAKTDISAAILAVKFYRRKIYKVAKTPLKAR